MAFQTGSARTDHGMCCNKVFLTLGLHRFRNQLCTLLSRVYINIWQHLWHSKLWYCISTSWVLRNKRLLETPEALAHPLWFPLIFAELAINQSSCAGMGCFKAMAPSLHPPYFRGCIREADKRSWFELKCNTWAHFSNTSEFPWT